MKLLAVGGTGFLGGAIVAEALTLGHDVTIFSRGLNQRQAPEGCRWVKGERYESFGPLKGEAFDIIVDTSAFEPMAVDLLLDAVKVKQRYAFISSISVYKDYRLPQLTEDYPLASATEQQFATLNAQPLLQRSTYTYNDASYGAMKAECEKIGQARLGEKFLSIRAGLITGAGDYTDRLTYWVRRADQGGEMAAPNPPQRLMQMIDVCDLAKFTLGCAEVSGGAFNATSRSFTFKAMLDACTAATGNKAELSWVQEAVIKAQGLVPWTDIPVWTPSEDEFFANILNVSAEKALAKGLHTRHLADTIETVLAWDRGQRDRPLKCGLTPEAEAKLLAAAA